MKYLLVIMLLICSQNIQAQKIAIPTGNGNYKAKPKRTVYTDAYTVGKTFEDSDGIKYAIYTVKSATTNVYRTFYVKKDSITGKEKRIYIKLTDN